MAKYEYDETEFTEKYVKYSKLIFRTAYQTAKKSKCINVFILL